MSQLQNLLDEKWPIPEGMCEEDAARTELFRRVFTEGYNARVAEEQKSTFYSPEDEGAKMSPFPWRIEVFDETEPVHLSIMCPLYGVASINYNTIVAKTSMADAKGIISAVMNTYGAAINPKGIKEVLSCLKDAVEELLMDFPDDDARKLRYQSAIEKAKL